MKKKPHPTQGTLKYYGFHACIKLWKSRPEDIIRVYVDEKSVKEASPLLKWCAKAAKAYHIISEEEMEKVSDSVHHEGLCILAKVPPELTFTDMLKKTPRCLLYLDGVQNPHNIGSIMRVAAHFGVDYILGKGLPKISPSTYRIAQGGAEHVKLIPLDDIKSSFQKLKQAGFHMVATSSHGGQSLFEYQFPEKTVIILGSESEGVGSQLMNLVQKTVMIPGSGHVESLNVSVATGLLLGEWFRQNAHK